LPPWYLKYIEEFKDQLTSVFIVSQVELKPASSVAIEVFKADGIKCVRCWNWRTDIGKNSEHPELCGRCAAQVKH
jgi:isoleucyl-tRNA synthetase